MDLDPSPVSQEAIEEADGDRSTPETKRNRGNMQGLLDSALILAVVSAGLYLVGRFYLDAFYHRLGLADTQLDFDIPFIMKSSFLPLLYPLVFLVLAAFMLSGLPPWQGRRDTWMPFYPLPASKVVAVVWGTWAAKIFADHQYPSAAVQWIAWDRRDVYFFIVGFTVLLALYTSYWVRRVLDRNLVLTGQTTGFGWLIGVPVLFMVVASILQRKWLLSAWPTTAVVLGIAWLGWMVSRDLMSLSEGEKDQDRTPNAPEPHVPRRGSILMLYTVAALALLLAAGLHGSLEAQETLDGCNSIRTIFFDPPLDDVNVNRTNWLVLQHNGIFYLRDLPPNSGNVTIAVPEDPGKTAFIGNHLASKVC